MASLSNTDLFYAPIDFQTGGTITLPEDEAHHVKVMRHKLGDTIFITNGSGKIAECTLESISKNETSVRVESIRIHPNKNANLIFCIPSLAHSDRLEFALEKCVELGITEFIFYQAERSIGKKIKIDRLQKIAAAAMKQSLQAWLPSIQFEPSLSAILQKGGTTIAFEQNAFKHISELKRDSGGVHYFLFGPEGGFSDKEFLLIKENAELYRLTENRLRAETAVVTAASLIAVTPAE